MAASYPGNIKSFATKNNTTDVVDASHVNDLQNEVVALETTLGTNISVSTAPLTTGTFNTSSTNFGTLNARLANIETGVVADSHNQYVHKVGGDTIQPTIGATPGLIIRAFSGSPAQSANLTEWRNSAGTLRTWIDQNGNLNTVGGVAATSSDVAELTGLVIAGVF
jgi:hypothetical protein